MNCCSSSVCTDETALGSEQRSCSEKSFEKEGEKEMSLGGIFSCGNDKKESLCKVMTVPVGSCATVRRKSVKVVTARAGTC